MFEPSTVALHGLLCNDYQGGGNVAILGGGTIGLFTAQWAKIFGAKQVVVLIFWIPVWIWPTFGADAVINSKEEGYQKQALEADGGQGL